MTPEQALANLDGAVATLRIDRQQHAILVESVNVLHRVITAESSRQPVVPPTASIKQKIEKGERDE